MNQDRIHESFRGSNRPHVLMITNHGVHEWGIVPGLQDTGGQNVFVNQFSEALARQGFRVTTVNRGGYRHPVHQRWQKGHSYKDQRQRIYYLEDDRKEFVRKEDMHEQIPQLAGALNRYVTEDDVPVDLIISHYWDAAAIGILYNQGRENKARHYCVPHSLGALKKKNLSFPLRQRLRIDERIAVEKGFPEKLDGIAATSSRVQRSLVEDYGYSGPELFLPPCVDTDRYHPRALGTSAAIWQFLSEQSGLARREIQSSVIITEISRTDSTKGKDILIRAFAAVHRCYPQTVLIVSIDQNQIELAAELDQLIRETPAGKHIVTVGSIWDMLPDLYAVSGIYCTPSRQEGFGMSAQEASATSVPVVASDRVPFVDEYLLGEEVKELQYGEGNGQVVRVGQGAIQVPVDDVAGFSYALELLLSDETARKEMGESAFALTIPAFTWKNAVGRFLQTTGIQRATRNKV